VCLDPLASGAALCKLPCTHTFHAECVEGLRSFGIQQVCPMCRTDLPRDPDKLLGKWGSGSGTCSGSWIAGRRRGAL